MRDEHIKEAFIDYLQNHSRDLRFFQALTNFTQLPYIGFANTPEGEGWEDLWYIEADRSIKWVGKDD